MPQASKQLTILHFNDVYNIDVSGSQEPVGGAARFVHAVQQQRQAIQQETGQQPLVLFSGDCFSPSLMSVSTLGKQMVPVLNALGIAAACVGNRKSVVGVVCVSLSFVGGGRKCASLAFNQSTVQPHVCVCVAALPAIVCCCTLLPELPDAAHNRVSQQHGALGVGEVLSAFYHFTQFFVPAALFAVPCLLASSTTQLHR